MSWPTLVDKIVLLQQRERLCIVRQLSAHDIVSRIMRKENYLIGLLNKGVLGLDLPWWVPGAGPMLNHDNKRLVLTKMVEWSLNWCILHHMFDRQAPVHVFTCSQSVIILNIYFTLFHCRMQGSGVNGSLNPCCVPFTE
jgi:autophagy-related protein 9